MPTEPLPASEDDALVALRDAVATLDPPPTSIDVAGIARRSTARADRRRGVVWRSVAGVAVAASAAGVIAGVVHLRGATATAESSASRVGASAPSGPAPSPAAAPSSTDSGGICRFANVVPASGQGAASARAAIDVWLANPSVPSPTGFPQDGWEQQPTAWVAGDVDFVSGDWRLETTELPGHGWFVTGGTTCR